MKKFKETEEIMRNQLKASKEKISVLKKEMEKAQNRMLLCRARMQCVDIKVAELNKLRPISQGTQMEGKDKDVEILDTDPDRVSNLPIVTIPDDEADIAIKNLLQSQEIEVLGVTNVATASNIATTSNVVTTSGVGILGSGIPSTVMGQGTAMTQNA